MTQSFGDTGGPARGESGSAAGVPPPRSDPTFADILNGFTLDRSRKQSRHTRPREDERETAFDAGFETGAEPPPEPDAAEPQRRPAPAWVERAAELPAVRRDDPPGWLVPAPAREPEPTDWAGTSGPFAALRPLLPPDDLGETAAMVRPYAWTRGRTRSKVDLKLETLVSTSEHGQDEALLGQVEYRAVGTLCRHPHSVAEVAAKLSIPLGVARVILSDMAELGLISIHRTFADDDIAAHLVLMERVLSGLRRL